MEFAVQNTIAIFIGKMLATAVVTALVSMAGIYFVVDMSQRGIEAAIETTNKRIDDLRTDLVSRIDLKFEALQLQLKNEFSETRKEFKKADIETGVKIAGALPGWLPVDFGAFKLFLDPKAASLASISKSDPVFAIWAENPQNAPELKSIEKNGLMVQAQTGDGIASAVVKWVEASSDSDKLLTEFLKYKECATISQLPDGSAIVVPIAATSVVGNDGFLCKPSLEQQN
jgi:hypothetical protein